VNGTGENEGASRHVKTAVHHPAAHYVASARRRLETLPLAELDAVLAYSTAAAAVTVSRAGADPPWPNEIQAPLLATGTPAQLPLGRRPR
jgi:hypothetical protein